MISRGDPSTHTSRPRSCESELRRCFLNKELDSTLEEGLIFWQSFCSGYISFTPTRPPLYSLTSTYNGDYCISTVRQACETGRILLASCSAVLTDADAFSSCTCRPALLRAEYTCEFLGNTSCLATGATLSSLFFYSGCSNFQTVIGTGPVSLSQGIPVTSSL